jgi:F-type H+-transporting ATPase subunit gamma
MASIKDLKKRISSTKNTQQTTKAMKMVSAAKLRRATDAILSQRPYALEIAKLMSILAGQGAGTKSDNEGAKKAVSLLVVFSSDRGLCGGYNGSVIRAGAHFIAAKTAAGKNVKTVFVGKKANELLRLRAKVDSVHFEEFGAKVSFKKATALAKQILPLFESGEVDEIVFVYNEFVNAITQEVKTDQVLPLHLAHHAKDDSVAQTLHSELAIYEPNKEVLFEALSGKYFVVQVFKALLEAQASEHGARMSAMENATKNAGDMIRKLTLQFNKQRQAAITKELLEIISGSESQKTQA